MDAVLTRNVLVLNRNWTPINITTVFDAICSVFRERASFIDPETYAVYDFEGWITNWEDAVHMAKIEIGSVGLIRTPSLSIVVPEIILSKDYKGLGFGMNVNGKPKFSRKNVYVRDHNTCMYCGKKHSADDLNIDHVVPRSKGGRSEWTNVVLSCVKCNNKKGDKTVSEAGMRLIRKPQIPTREEVRRPLSEMLRRKLGSNVPKSWEALLGKMYWNVELKD